MKLMVSAERSYARNNNSGFGVRSVTVNPARLIMSPRCTGSVTPPRVSVSVDRGLAYCPANRPTRMTRFLPLWVSTSPICSSIFSLYAIEPDSQSAKLSEQSPPCSRNRSPRVASASCCFRVSISQLVTSGGSRES
jgi:hypothetical protein